jgi:aryl-alcohol dehydrogenase-like predicted oxidoreductase
LDGKVQGQSQAAGSHCGDRWIVPIPGTRKLERIEENIGAASIELTASDLADVDKAFAEIPVQGERYPEHLEATTGR